MNIQNKSAKGKWIHVKINGFSYKHWLGAYATINLPEVTNLSQLNLNAHEEAMVHEQAHTGINPDPTPTPEFYFVVAASRLGLTGGTTSLSASSVSVAQGMSLSFSVYPHSDFYLSAYTINGSATTILTPSATTVYTLTNIQQDKNISVAFARKGQ